MTSLITLSLDQPTWNCLDSLPMTSLMVEFSLLNIPPHSSSMVRCEPGTTRTDAMPSSPVNAISSRGTYERSAWGEGDMVRFEGSA